MLQPCLKVGLHLNEEDDSIENTNWSLTLFVDNVEVGTASDIEPTDEAPAVTLVHCRTNVMVEMARPESDTTLVVPVEEQIPFQGTDWSSTIVVQFAYKKSNIFGI